MLKSKSFLQIFFSCLIVIAVGVLIVKAATTIGTNISTDGNLTVSGTITQGTWNGSTIGVAYGGTASTTLSGILKGNGTGMVATAVADTDYLLPATAATLYAPLASPTFTGLTTLANATSSQLTTTGSTYLATTGGNVGIGTTSPWGFLSVEQDAESNSFIVSNTGSSTPSFTIKGVNGNGNIGIGTASPANKLEVSGTVNILDNNGSYYYTIGSSGVLSTQPGFIIQRYITTGTGNAHGFSENTYYRRNGTAYASFDAYTRIGGSGNNFDHIAAYQDRISFAAGSGSNTMANMYGYYGAHTNSGTLTNNYYFLLKTPTNTGTILNNYGLYIEDQSVATNNFAIYTAGNTPSYFGGYVGIGTTTPSSLLTASAGANATTTVEFGDQYSVNSKSCFNVKTSDGANASFYFNASGIVFENNRCR